MENAGTRTYESVVKMGLLAGLRHKIIQSSADGQAYDTVRNLGMKRKDAVGRYGV